MTWTREVPEIPGQYNLDVPGHPRRRVWIVMHPTRLFFGGPLPMVLFLDGNFRPTIWQHIFVLLDKFPDCEWELVEGPEA
jgi:hypothetical protein